MITAARLSAGYAIGLPIATVVFFVLVGFAILFWVGVRHDGFRDSYGWSNVGMGAVVFTVLSVLAALGFPWFFFPWSIQYHEWVNKTGTVSIIGNKFTDGQATSDTSGSVFGDFVVQFTGSPTRYDCLDTRCALIKRGDHVTMSCIRAFQWTGVPGWNCNYAKDESR